MNFAGVGGMHDLIYIYICPVIAKMTITGVVREK